LGPALTQAVNALSGGAAFLHAACRELRTSAHALLIGFARRRASREHAALSPVAPAKKILSRAGTPGERHRGIRRTL